MKVLSYLEIKIEDHNDLDNTSYSKMYKFLDEKGWSGTMREYYSQPFKPELITELFEGWEVRNGASIIWKAKDTTDALLFDDSLKCGIYIIRGALQEKFFRYQSTTPRTLDEFITDCTRAGIELIWRLK